MAGEFFLLYCTAIVAKNNLPSSFKCKRQHVYLQLTELSAPSLFYSGLRQHPRGAAGAAEPIPIYLVPLLRETPLRLGALQRSFSPQVIKVPQPEGDRGKDCFHTETLPILLHTQGKHIMTIPLKHSGDQPESINQAR